VKLSTIAADRATSGRSSSRRLRLVADPCPAPSLGRPSVTADAFARRRPPDRAHNRNECARRTLWFTGIGWPKEP
jgi:hypothetical protein